ncbi:DUF2517 family protein [Providencia rustigianii]|uniref:Protein of uncharacterized function (DUF2517) n=1 Tax=Providencia rustigianii TaxID=158850 RepID=A0A379G1K9_9GAMM|nr:YbfA family protein [Providencia rustigianii]MTC61119.1 DUF2517 family protein [Providencia rustigianii]SUC34807.1 Protein of uncharacterised function (DUF2517) [Providencia rustigianii]VEH54569.1 Protein of uncharacterised function (DUF2517) [Providencia rustigianii]
MSTYQEYSRNQVILRRTAAVTAGVIAFPVMVFYPKRARFYSYLHKVWAKTSDKPVWLASSEVAMESHR